MPKQYKLLNNPEDTPSNPLTWERLMSWLVDTGYIEGLVRKRISPLDRHLIDDYIQEVWVQILEVPHDKLLDVYRRGKGKFVNYLKSIVVNNIYSGSSHLYKNLRAGQKELVHLNDNEWVNLEENEETHFLQHFPVINRDRGVKPSERVSFEYDYSGVVRPKNKLYE